MRESIHGLRGDLLCLEVSWCDYMRHISRTQSFQENRPFIFQVRVVLKTLVSLMGLLEPCSVRIAADRRTHTHRPSTSGNALSF